MTRLPGLLLGLTTTVVLWLATSCSDSGSSSDTAVPRSGATSSLTTTSSGSTDSTAPETPTPSQTTPPPIRKNKLHGKLIFTRAGGKYEDETVYAAYANGTHVRRITPYGTQCCPRWSSDGRHIWISALAPDGRITTGIIEPDGTHERKIPLPKGSLNLGCSGPSGPTSTGRIACEGWSDTEPSLSGIYTVRASDGRDLVRVTFQGERPMDFQPDGSRIFFFRSVQGFPAPTGESEGSLFVVNSDGTHVRRITPKKMPVEVVGNAGGRLSHDGRLIAFTSDGAIWTIRPDGTRLTKLFQDKQGRLAITPTWSPDDRMLLFGLDPADTIANIDAAPPNGLYVIRADGTDLSPVLIGSGEWMREPDWAT